MALQRNYYRDRWNEKKVWEVVKLVGGYYLRQYISGQQVGRGMKTSKKFIKSIGVYYNDPEHLVVRENENPRKYFENVAEDHVLSMAFEGSVCHMLWYGTNPGIKKKFDKIFEKRGLYYEFGDHWNFTCYYIQG